MDRDKRRRRAAIRRITEGMTAQELVQLAVAIGDRGLREDVVSDLRIKAGSDGDPGDKVWALLYDLDEVVR